MKCLRFVWIMVSDCRKQTGPPDARNNLQKSHFFMCHVTKYSTILGVFQQPWPGVSPTAILNEEKALGTRLIVTRRQIFVGGHLVFLRYFLVFVHLSSLSVCNPLREFGELIAFARSTTDLGVSLGYI